MMVAGFIYPSGGSIHYRGQNITYMPPHLRNIGMVFQNYSLFPHRTVGQNVAFPLRVRRLSKTEITARVQQALALVGLDKYIDRMPRELSGGQQQRVALARALVYQPELLLMDEPLGALDRNLREQMKTEIKRIHEATGVTILYVTHDQGEALAMSDRILVMHEGRLRAMGTPSEIYLRPKEEFVARFIGEATIVRGRITAIDEGVCQLETSGGLTLSAFDNGIARKGDLASLLIRPEVLKRDIQNKPGHNSLEGIVSAVTYQGDSVRCLVDVEALPESLGMRLPVQREFVLPRPGDRIAVGWHFEDGWLLPAAGAPEIASSVS
jgi:putative spermidine/putrescine transport system ATP-binding protein